MNSSDHILPAQQPRILIVEDETLVSWSLSTALRKVGFIVVAVTSGEQALEKLNSLPFDLVITDVNLPHIDGYSVVAAVKTFHPRIPVVMMSAIDDPLSDVVHADVDGFIEKPFDLREVVVRISTLLATQFQK